jgi:hypothetical protein
MDINAKTLVIAVSALGISLLGCGGSAEVATDEVSQAVYVDTKTMQAVVCDIVDEPPALNPKTGQRTLMPALFCPTCQAWHPVPPADQINRVPGATTCRKTGAALTTEGPWPE